LAFTVQTGDGILVPVIQSASKLAPVILSRKVKELTVRAKNGEATMADFENGTFTVTNLGSYGISSFTPILHHPQVAALGLCKPELCPEMDENGVRYVNKMTISLTVDHRAVSSVQGALFLEQLCENIEQMELLFFA
jgi:pyruvate dehydrogenase E2 component (dihydrolipoamide acetyltransferase)